MHMANEMTRRGLMTGAALAAGGCALLPRLVRAGAANEDAVSHSAAVIHQEPVFGATAQRIYQALMDPKQFDQIARLSEAMQGDPMQKLLVRHPSRIGEHAGGSFALFGGLITGRHIKLIPGELIIQAWRAQDWSADDYSIVRFKLSASGSGTKIVFDHVGFPSGDAEHLAAGWKANYWGPLAKILS
jgi:activator of HSP90 ATPase